VQECTDFNRLDARHFLRLGSRNENSLEPNQEFGESAVSSGGQANSPSLKDAVEPKAYAILDGKAYWSSATNFADFLGAAQVSYQQFGCTPN
jgi:hypothetical protein